MKQLYTIMFASLCLTTALMAQDLRKEGRYYVAEIEKTFDVSGPGLLRLDNVHGDIVIKGWNRNQVFIREEKRMDVFTEQEAKTVLEKSKSDYRKQGNDIIIAGESFSRDWIRSEFEIQIPVAFSLHIGTSGGDIEIFRVGGSVELRTSGGDIVLDDVGGDISAKTSGGDISVNDSKGILDLKTSGGDIELESIRGPLSAKTSGGDISLNGASAKAEVHTSGGDLDITDVRGALTAHTSGGDIEVSDTRADATLHTSGGDIELRMIGGNLNASTSGGDIEADGIDGSAQVSTSGGSIELADVKGGVEAKTSGGDIEVAVTLTDMKKPHEIDLRTAGGSIELHIPANLPANIKAEVENSNRWETYRIYSDFPITISDEGSRDERRRFVTGEGEINGGGDLIQIYTVNGDIYIKKLDQ